MEILNDFQTSLRKAFSEIDPKYESYDGLVICGTHAPHNTEEMIKKIQQARETGVPFLGICFGMQLMAIEYARNVLRIKDATSEEFGTGTFVVQKMPGFRIGQRPVGQRFESFWHQYSVDSSYFIGGLWRLTYSENFPAIMILEGYPFFVGTQFHPEYESSKGNYHPLLVQYIDTCKKLNGSAVGVPH